MMDREVVVIGAGIGGLTAAIRLATKGYHVIVLERNSFVGGKMAEIVESGYRWDSGPSVITMLQVLEELFAQADRSIGDYLDFVPVDPLTRYFYPDHSHLDISRDISQTLQQIGLIDHCDVEGYLSFLAYAARLYRITAPVFTFGPPPSLGSFSLTSFKDFVRVAPSALRRMDAVIRGHVRSSKLQQVLGRFATYVGSSPYLSTALLSVIAHVELNQGVWYPRGGVYSIVNALLKLAMELGVEIRTGMEVNTIACRHDLQKEYCVSGVSTNEGTFIPASSVIANVDVTTVYEKLLPRERRFQSRLKKLEQMEPSCSGFVILLGVEGTHPELVHHNIFFSSDYRHEFDQIFHLHVPPVDPTIYVSISSKTDAGHAPPGCENWFVLVNVPADNGTINWTVQRDQYSELVLSRLATYGLDIGKQIRVRKVVTPIDLENLNGARHGSLYGVSFNDNLAPFKRPGNRCPDIKGLYFVGGTTHPGGGVPMVMLSGKVVSEMISG
jgi:phytoene desaturase